MSRLDWSTVNPAEARVAFRRIAEAADRAPEANRAAQTSTQALADVLRRQLPPDTPIK